MVTSFKKTKARHSILAKMYSKIASPKTSFKGLAIYIGALSAILIFIAAVGIYFFYLHALPKIESIESDSLPESTIIYDRNGGELYNLYSKEKRTYVEYDQISQPMREAIVATEDKTFFENAGVDLKGLLRSGINFITGKTEKLEGTSTISQQLIKNTFLSNERSFERKFKEIYLSYELNSKYSKEKILELYLNKISFGNNAFGVEEASKTYFGKSVKDVGVLGATILASIPKGPTYYSPYSHRDRLMGYLYTYDQGDTAENQITLDSPEKMKEDKKSVDEFKNIVTSMKVEKYGDGVSICDLKKEQFKSGVNVDKNGCTEIGYKDMLTFFNSIRIESERDATVSSGTGVKAETGKQKIYLEYNTGRKDFVATRMFEDGKITVEQLKDVIVGGLDFQFKKYAENIKYPYFVFYVKEFLENKYGKDFEAQGGLKIYTTIDPKLQDKAEELVKKQVKINISKYGASSAALVSMDNKSGQILSMVG